MWWIGTCSCPLASRIILDLRYPSLELMSTSLSTGQTLRHGNRFPCSLQRDAVRLWYEGLLRNSNTHDHKKNHPKSLSRFMINWNSHTYIFNLHHCELSSTQLSYLPRCVALRHRLGCSEQERRAKSIDKASFRMPCPGMLVNHEKPSLATGRHHSTCNLNNL